ncbi:unnamed protein product [marine sediment metagenome]|uniref:Uncharacterized protein n=1 Tax=marine sediment metagenome TaxID=412755 RepID=X1DRL7_9ZZZZ
MNSPLKSVPYTTPVVPNIFILELSFASSALSEVNLSVPAKLTALSGISKVLKNFRQLFNDGFHPGISHGFVT